MSEAKHDPDTNRLMAKIMDDIDARLFKHGLQFRGDDLEPATEELRALIFKYYDDITGGDSSYDPNADKSTEVDSDDDEESVSASLHASDEEASMSDRSTSESGEVRETKKQKN